MKQKTLVRALGASLALMLPVGAMAAQPVGDSGPERVLIKFKHGSKGLVQREIKDGGATIHYSFDAINTIAATMPAQALRGLRNNPNVELIEADAKRYPDAQVTPYGIDLVQTRAVWDADADGTLDPGAPTGDGILVCVIDSGIHAGHEDFAGVNLVGGHPKTWNYDNCGHGTHVAGTIAAAHNTAGVVGVSPGKASLYIVKVFGNEEAGQCTWTFSSQLIDAANRCAARGARVINMSLGGGGPSQAESETFEQLNKRGVLSIAAAGNHGNPANSTDAQHYPASYDAVLSVAAVNSSKVLAGFSAKNDQVELAGPGVSVLSTTPFVFPPVVSGGDEYAATPMTNTFQGSATPPLVNGGLCNALPGDNSWSGKVVLCQRGAAPFLLKSQNVANSGGVAAVIYNNVAGTLNGTLGTDLTVIPAIPVVGITQSDGQTLLANHVGDATTVDSVVQLSANGYEFYSGTSMATPHVAGVAALVWSANPNWSNQQIREALSVTAEDLGTAGYDTSYGWGLVQAKAALDELQSH